MKRIIFISFILLVSSAMAAEMKLSSPHIVKKGEEFSMYIAASNLQNFYSADLLIKYNSSAMDIVKVCNGSINATEIAVNYSIENGVCRIVAISSDEGVDGDGYLAILKVIPIMEGEFNITIEGNLSNYNAERMQASWSNLTVAFTSSELKIEAKDVVSGEFVAYINLTNATQFYSVNFTLLYDDTFLMPKEIENDSLSISHSIDSGKIKFAGYMDEAKDVEEINIVKILFHPLKTGYTFLNLTHITASNIFAQQIYCLAINKSILISGNVPPIANFTWQPQNPTDLDEITFNASFSYDIDGYIANYTWNFGDGSIAYGRNVQHRYEDDGLYIVNLTVIDNEGAVAWITKQIEVFNMAPVADFDFTPSEPIVGESTAFNSTSYDLDGFIANYTWNFGDGSIAYGRNVSHVYYNEGSYIVNLTIKDDDGAEAWIAKEVVVSLANHPPYATNPYPSNGSVDVSIEPEISVVVYDEDGDAINASFYDASTDTLIGSVDGVSSGSTASITWHKLDFSKTYYWYVIVSDRKEEYKSDVWHFTTRGNSPPSKPTISGVANGYTGISYSFSAKSYDEDGDKIRYGFDWNNDGNVDEWSGLEESGKTVTKSHSWNIEGVYYIRVIAEDEYGASSDWSDLHQIIITQYTPPNTKPVVSIEYPKESDVLSGVVEIKGSAWDADGDEIQKVEIRIDRGEWKLANGTTSWNYKLDTTKLSNGWHIIEARCYDGMAYSNVAMVNVTVNNFVNTPPYISIIYPSNGTIVSNIITIQGNAWDEDGNESLVKVEIRIDGGEWKEATGIINWTYALDTTKLSNGTHIIEARAYDGMAYSQIAKIKINVQNEKEERDPWLLIVAIVIIAIVGVGIWFIKRK
ncbi:MAG: PKD domain-containing protein [Thermoplasmata archaeon]|nr:PKD domain-containing protein [Thermoplasmata archaeon]